MDSRSLRSHRRGILGPAVFRGRQRDRVGGGLRFLRHLFVDISTLFLLEEEETTDHA